MPWVESPFFYDLLKDMDLTVEEENLAVQFHELGYCIIDLNFSAPSHYRDFDGIIKSIEDRLLSQDFKQQEDGYHYSLGKRVFEAWKWSKEVLNLCKHPSLLKTLEFLYGKKPQPFQTINFKIGSNQPLHSDVIHFSSMPQGWVAAAWVALEDMDDFNGTLRYVPGSHKLPFYDFQSLNLPVAEYGKQFESYAVYEEFIVQLVKSTKLEIEKFYAKKGEALVWAANLIHGGDKIRDLTRTRWSQAIHYYFPGCEKYYCPMFSNLSTGLFSEKDLNEKDILNYEIN